MIDETILLEQLNKKKWESTDFIQFDDEGLTPNKEECYSAGRRLGRYEAFSESIQIVKELRGE